jgi:hypothetical protein
LGPFALFSQRHSTHLKGAVMCLDHRTRLHLEVLMIALRGSKTEEEAVYCLTALQYFFKAHAISAEDLPATELAETVQQVEQMLITVDDPP